MRRPARTEAPPARGFSPGFAALGLEATLLTTLDTLGYEEPTPIQREAIPPLLAGRDLLGQAATGTGKTAAFTLPLLQRIAHSARRCSLRADPGADQRVGDTGRRSSHALRQRTKDRRAPGLWRAGHRSAAPCAQAWGRCRGGDAWPGAGSYPSKNAAAQDIQMVVLDEADEMLDMGFAEDLDAILEQTPEERQTALFSATMPPRIASIAKRHLKDPVEIKIAQEPLKAGSAPRVHQTAYIVARPHKVAALARILDMDGPKSALVFCRTRLEVDELTAMLKDRAYHAEAIHGGMSQAQRDRVMNSFRSGQTELLVATDVAARGLDIPTVSHVMNYDVPSAPRSLCPSYRTDRPGRT